MASVFPRTLGKKANKRSSQKDELAVDGMRVKFGGMIKSQGGGMKGERVV